MARSGRGNRSPFMRGKGLIARALRGLLYRYVRAKPLRPEAAERRVLILLTSAWGMGGTIRAAYNMAGHLAASGYEVEILSVWRRREEPFFGSFPPHVKVTVIDDVRPNATPRALRPLRAILRTRSSVLYSPLDRYFHLWNLWVDVMVMRRLRRGSGFLVTTRPGLNLLIADLHLPGWITVGLEQMNLQHHRPRVQSAMAKRYGNLDVLVALTEDDVGSYEELLDGGGRLVCIPNTVFDIGGPWADLDAKTVQAAGRLVHQKGFDFLIRAYAQIGHAHPDWRLRICGRGEWQERLEQEIAAHGLGDFVELVPAATDLPNEMERASIFVLSSRYEGFPLVLLEAMGKGMAVVAFDCPTGPAEIIRDGVNGILAPPEDVDRLAAGIRAQIEDPGLRRRCAAAAIDTAHEYTIESVGPRWEALFVRLWQERHAGPTAVPESPSTVMSPHPGD